MKYAILKNLAGTYCATLHLTSDDLDSLSEKCTELNKEGKHGITYHLISLADYKF